MCEPALFYYSLDVNEKFMPTETCIQEIACLLHEEAKPYAESCAGACFMNFLMMILHWTMYNNGKKSE